jgi:hypothetical protein
VSPGQVRSALVEAGVPPTPPARKRRRKRPAPRRFERSRPNQLWQSDITSLVLARQGHRIYLTVFLDDHSRYVVAHAVSSQQRGSLVIEALRDGIARYGKPSEVLTDQGRQYFAWRGKSAFQKELSRQGIRHVVARARHPQTVGKCERLWETVQRELWERCEVQDISEARERLTHFFAHYNHFRPHQGISSAVPADRFFGAESPVREALAASLSANELALALSEAPRRPVYLAGQIGEQSLSVHGERGKLVIVTPEGGRQELSYDELGVGRGEDREVREVRDGEVQQRQRSGEADASGDQAGALSAVPASGGGGAGALGVGERGGEAPGTSDVRGDAGVLAGQEEQGAGDGGPGSAGAAGVAAVAAGALGYARRPAQAAAASGAAGRGDGGDGAGGRSQGPAEADRAAGEGAARGEEADGALAGPAGAAEPGGSETCAGERSPGGRKSGASSSSCASGSEGCCGRRERCDGVIGESSPDSSGGA